MLQRTSRRTFLLAPFLAASSSAYAKLVEPTWLEFTHRDCPLPFLRDPIRLLHLSDLHASTEVPTALIEQAFQLAVEATPDLICITGDFVTVATGFDPDWYVRALKRLSASAPTFAVLGNHDGGSWAHSDGGLPTTETVSRLLTRAGIDLLHNRCRTFQKGSTTLQLAGVGDVWAREMDPTTAFAQADPNLPTVLLSHNPDTKSLMADRPWHLMLSGHTHGGQVVLPLFGLNPAPVRDKAYVAGLKPWGDRWIHVSRGVGSIAGLRFNCRPEVTLLHLIPETT